MILYALACDAGHRFESWFRDGATYDTQLAHGFLACPVCRSTAVAKTIMAPAIVGGRPQVGHPEVPVAAAVSVVPDASVELALVDDKSREMRALLRAVRDKVVAEGRDVGTQFAVEARRMHEGDTPVAQIYGQASPAEARDLLEDGIMILPMPVLPDELN